MPCAPRYELLHCVRTHRGASDESYACVYQQEDASGKVGVHLSKELMVIAGRSLKANITTLAPLVLPLSEQALFVANLIGRKVGHVHALCIPLANLLLSLTPKIQDVLACLWLAIQNCLLELPIGL